MRARRTDANHDEIALEFESLGCTVHRTNADWDLTIGWGGLTRLIEIKDGSKPPSRQKLTAREAKFHRTWTGGIYLIRNVEDVRECVDSLRWLVRSSGHSAVAPDRLNRRSRTAK